MTTCTWCTLFPRRAAEAAAWPPVSDRARASQTATARYRRGERPSNSQRSSQPPEPCLCERDRIGARHKPAQHLSGARRRRCAVHLWHDHAGERVFKAVANSWTRALWMACIRTTAPQFPSTAYCPSRQRRLAATEKARHRGRRRQQRARVTVHGSHDMRDVSIVTHQTKRPPTEKAKAPQDAGWRTPFAQCSASRTI